MEFTQKQNLRILCALLILTVVTQALYTALYSYASDLPRLWLWRLEGLIFIVLAVIAGTALAQAKSYTLGFSAILISAVFNFLQVGIGLTQFGPFREVGQDVAGAAPVIGAIVGFSFFIYNGAKILLGIAAIVFGSAVSQNGSKILGRLTALVGVIALLANTIVIMFGSIKGLPSGAVGVVATLLLAVCLLKLQSED